MPAVAAAAVLGAGLAARGHVSGTRVVSAASARRAERSVLVVRAAKGKGGGGGGGGAKAPPSKPSGGSSSKSSGPPPKSSGGGGGGGGGAKGKGSGSSVPKFKSPGEVKEGAAYAQETRKTILTMNRLSKTTPNGKVLLKNISLGIYLGAKIGILGANGAGKSTLMKLLAGVDTAFEGDYTVQPGLRIGYLPQEPKLDAGETVRENIEPGVATMRAKLREFDEVSAAMADPSADMDSLMQKMERLQNDIDAANGWELDRQVERAMDALRCPPGDAKVAVLSGGERRRVALCRLLLSQPEMLLLDEPTNHLDAQSVAWLERFLADFPGTVVAITHDRFFLDNVAGWILELDRGQGIPFEGNYSQWLEAKAKRLQAEEQAQASLEKAILREYEYVSKQRQGQQKKGKARLRQYDQLVEEANAFVRASALDSITIPVGPRLGDVVVEAKQLVKARKDGFGDRLLIDGLDFQLPPSGIVGVVGANGAGKSTLFRMILGTETPDGGELRVGDTVRPMCAEQLRDSLQDDKTVFETIAEKGEELVINGRPVNARAYLTWYNFKGGDQQKKVGDLSGGERNRLQLAKTLLQGGNVLMLDEPTNDLDVATLRCLEDAVANFAGCVIVISHDRWFLDRLASHILAFEGDSQVVWFEGSWSEYEADRRKRTGQQDPTRIKYRPMAALK